jgi:tRNA(Ile)-lysidine synthase
MQSKFLSALNELLETSSETPILVAVSGGIDSMALASLFYENGFRIGVAHCNYQLRGKDSDDDEALVRDWCADRKIPLHIKKVNTSELARTSNDSIQMIARNERYGFFEELMSLHGYAVTALAHHADDRVESLLINVLRGTGIRGMQGMPSKRGWIIRPLINCTKEEIRQYAKLNSIPYRDDVSNRETNYKRNWVRLRLIPMLRASDDSSVNELHEFCEKVENALPAYESWVEKQISDALTGSGLSIGKINDSKAPFTLLKEHLKRKGFSSDQVFEVLSILDSASGAEVRSESHRVVKDRDHLIIEPLKSIQSVPELKYETLARSEVKSLKTDPNIALVDADLVRPSAFSLRNWQEGDRFKPLGMNGWKKLSDFFIDEKLSVSEKSKTWLLTNGSHIIWVVGKRLDDRFKVSSETQKVLKITVGQ